MLKTFGDTITDRGSGSPLRDTGSNSKFFDTIGNRNAFSPAPVRSGSNVLPELNSGALDQTIYSRKLILLLFISSDLISILTN